MCHIFIFPNTNESLAKQLLLHVMCACACVYIDHGDFDGKNWSFENKFFWFFVVSCSSWFQCFNIIRSPQVRSPKNIATGFFFKSFVFTTSSANWVMAKCVCSTVWSVLLYSFLNFCNKTSAVPAVMRWFWKGPAFKCFLFLNKKKAQCMNLFFLNEVLKAEGHSPVSSWIWLKRWKKGMTTTTTIFVRPSIFLESLKLFWRKFQELVLLFKFFYASFVCFCNYYFF